MESNAERSTTRKLLIAPPGGDGFAHPYALRPGPDSWRLTRLDASLGPGQFRTSFGPRPCRRIQPAGEKEALNLNRALPDLNQRVNVGVLRLKESTLGDEHLRVRGGHLLEAGEVELISTPRAWQHLPLVLRDHTQRVPIIAEHRGHPRSQREFDAAHFALGDLQLGVDRADVALIAVEYRQTDPDFEEAFRPCRAERDSRRLVAHLQELSAVSESAAQEKIGNAFGLGARDGRAGALDGGLRALQLRAPADQHGEGRIFIELRETLFQIADQTGWLEEWVADNRAQLLPHLILAVLGHNQIQLRPLRLDLDLIRVWAVSLSDVEELFCNADGFAGDAGQFCPRLDAPLRPQSFVEEHPHCVQNSIALRYRLLFGQDFLLGEDALALAEFAAEQDGLLDEGKMLTLLIESARVEF